MNFLVILVLASIVSAQIPKTISYQGILLDAAGQKVLDGDYPMTFSLCQNPSDAPALWEESQSIAIMGGIFNAILGSRVPLNLRFDKPYWLGVTIGSGDELSPRTQLTAAAYSLSAYGMHGGSNAFPAEGNVGIGVREASEKLQVAGVIHSAAGGFRFPDGSVQTSAAGSPAALPFDGVVAADGYAFSIGNTAEEGHGGWFEAGGDSGIGLYAKGGANGCAAEFQGKVIIRSWESATPILEFGEGLDYAEGFSLADGLQAPPGTVLIIDEANPGRLTLTTLPYDKRVAGIVAGAHGLGSGVRLGGEKFTHSLALAGRVYCQVEATEAGVEPGDLLTTSSIPGFAMKAKDRNKACGAVLGKAMESLPKGKRGYILVLVTLQ